jgi:hypothetical protein
MVMVAHSFKPLRRPMVLSADGVEQDVLELRSLFALIRLNHKLCHVVLHLGGLILQSPEVLRIDRGGQDLKDFFCHLIVRQDFVTALLTTLLLLGVGELSISGFDLSFCHLDCVLD